MTLRGFNGVAKELPCSGSCLKNKSNSSKLPTALPSSAYDCCNTCVFWTNLSKGGVGTSCIAIAMSPFELCFRGTAVFYLRRQFVLGWEWVLNDKTKKTGQIILIFLTANREMSFSVIFFRRICKAIEKIFWQLGSEVFLLSKLLAAEVLNALLRSCRPHFIQILYLERAAVIFLLLLDPVY